ncbi:hypothetical protein H8356DRAFT_1426705 [Neocallimastix lanati (nom. inval.)]|nr:hypothetical protein H8356DRAFT_1426705 [Neocallimastix sp. JGI-2020a]
MCNYESMNSKIEHDFKDFSCVNAVIVGIIFSFVEMVSCIISPLRTKNLITSESQ